MSLETIDKLGKEFNEYLGRLPSKVKDRILPKSSVDVFLGKNHPLKTNGFDPGLVLHFQEFIKLKKAEFEKEEGGENV